MKLRDKGMKNSINNIESGVDKNQLHYLPCEIYGSDTMALVDKGVSIMVISYKHWLQLGLQTLMKCIGQHLHRNAVTI